MTKKILIYACLAFSAIIFIFTIFFYIPSEYKSRIKVNDYLISSKSDKNLKMIKVAVFSDLHIGHDYSIENLPLLIDSINATKPDVVVFNGDLLASKVKLSNKQQAALINNLEQLRPVYGKFAIIGDQDSKAARNLLFESGFEELNNKNRQLIINGRKLVISGLNGNNWQNALKKLNKKNINLGFIHNPSEVEKISKYNLNTLVTGHTMGGIYNLPLIGSVYSDVRKIPYYKGNKIVNDTWIINNKGIGVNHGNMRFRAPSAIDILKIQ